jgi:hypothetical protein
MKSRWYKEKSVEQTGLIAEAQKTSNQRWGVSNHSAATGPNPRPTATSIAQPPQVLASQPCGPAGATIAHHPHQNASQSRLVAHSVATETNQGHEQRTTQISYQMSVMTAPA